MKAKRGHPKRAAALYSHAKKSARQFFATIFIIGLATVAQAQSTTITFDDFHTADYTNTGVSTIPTAMYVPAITNGYMGLNWSNFYALDGGAYVYLAAGGSSGYGNAVVSPKNVAFDGSGNPADISSDSPFNLNSGYFTAAWNNGLNLEVQGFDGANLLYDQTYVLNRSGPLFIVFDFYGITDVHFISSGGVGDGVDAPATNFAMDNLTISPVPEPSTLALTGLGGLGLLGLRRQCKRSFLNRS